MTATTARGFDKTLHQRGDVVLTHMEASERFEHNAIDDGDDYIDDGDEQPSSGEEHSDANSDSVTLDSPSGDSARIKSEMEISPPRRKPTGKATSTHTTAPTRANVTTKPAAAKPRARKSAATAAAAAGPSMLDDPQRALAKCAATAERKQASIDQRRKRNREAMQRARQRDKDYMDGLRDLARDLEQQHSALLARVDERLAVATTAGARMDAQTTALQQQLERARAQAETLKRQNLAFLDAIGDRIKREDRMEGLLRELMCEQAAQEHALNEIFRASLSESQLGVLYTEARAMREILRSRADRRDVERFGFNDPSRVVRSELFGWATQYNIAADGSMFHFAFTKTFRHVCAMDAMERNWQNAMNMVSYRHSVQAATQRWHVVQQINADTFLLARELTRSVATTTPSNDAFVRLLYLRFRVHEADGSFSVVTQSVQDVQDSEHETLYAAVQDVWATEACMWTLFTPVREQLEDGSVAEHCTIHMVGRSTVGSPAAAQQNVLETIFGLLRWENINIGPMLSLTNA